MSKMINMYTFSTAFGEPFVKYGKTLYLLKDGAPEKTLDMHGKTVVKIAGKNSIKDMMAKFNNDLNKVMTFILSLVDNPKQKLVIVFDGDPLEDNAPFTALVPKIASYVYAVVAVKPKHKKGWGYSELFVKGWSGIPNMLFVESEDKSSYEWNEAFMNDMEVHHVVNVYSTLFQFRPESDGGGETTGYKQLVEQKAKETGKHKTITDGVAYGVVVVTVKHLDDPNGEGVVVHVKAATSSFSWGLVALTSSIAAAFGMMLALFKPKA